MTYVAISMNYWQRADSIEKAVHQLRKNNHLSKKEKVLVFQTEDPNITVDSYGYWRYDPNFGPPVPVEGGGS